LRRRVRLLAANGRAASGGCQCRPARRRPCAVRCAAWPRRSRAADVGPREEARVLVEQTIAEQFRALGLGEPDFSTPPADFNVAMSGAHVLPGALVGNVAYITAIPSVKERWYLH